LNERMNGKAAQRTADAGGSGLGMRAGKVAAARNGLWAGVAALTVLAACGEREVILPGERFPVRSDLTDSIPVEGEAPPKAPDATPAAESRPIQLQIGRAHV